MITCNFQTTKQAATSSSAEYFIDQNLFVQLNYGKNETLSKQNHFSTVSVIYFFACVFFMSIFTFIIFAFSLAIVWLMCNSNMFVLLITSLRYPS